MHRISLQMAKKVIHRKLFRTKLQVIACYPDGDAVLKQFNYFDEASTFFATLIDFRLRNYMSFRSLRLVDPATKRVFFEYKDYRYIEKQSFENLYSYELSTESIY